MTPPRHAFTLRQVNLLASLLLSSSRVRLASLALLAAAVSACGTTSPAYEEAEAVILVEEPVSTAAFAEAEEEEEASLEEEGEVSLVVAEEAGDAVPVPQELEEIIVQGRVPVRHEVIQNLVLEAQALLRDVQLEYFFTGKGKKETLRGRPVVFALWNEKTSEWTLAHVEIPRPPIKWKPGKKPLPFVMRTAGIQARHVKGTGAERLMFAFEQDGEPLKVFGRKFPVFDSGLINRKRWREVAATAQPIVYLPFTQDTFDPLFVSGGKDYLLATANQAIADLRAANVPSAAFPGMLLADVVPPEVITTLAVIEQTDDTEYVEKQEGAFNDVLNHYGLKRENAYRYSVSTASAIGPMQFTNRRGNGTYALVVRRCPGARIDPVFERGATDLLNAMKAAICLLDIELMQMRREIREAYRDNPQVLGIFPVAAYNGGPRNVTRLFNVVKKAGVKLEELGRPGEQPLDKPVRCPCFWKQVGAEVRPVTIPRYNNENRWYVEKYQAILHAFEPPATAGEITEVADASTADGG